MSNYITIGEYNKLYKYIWIYIIIKLLFQYLFGTDFPEEIKVFKKYSFPKNVLIQEGFNYLGLLFLSAILHLYEKIQEKKDLKVSINNTDNNDSSKNNHKISLIFFDYEKEIKSYKSIIIIIILLVLSDQLWNTFFVLNLKGLDFRMFELLFVCIITFIMFRIEIYNHKKLAIIFILIFCVTMKSLSILFRLIDDHKKRIFKIYTWIIPLGITFFLLISLLKSYTLCKIKYLLEFEFISITELLLFYGIIGFFICSLISIIPSCIPCVDINSFENIELVCNVTLINYDQNSTAYYYENYLSYFRNIWRDNRPIFINILYIFLLTLELIFSSLTKLYSIIIIKNLSQEYLICTNSIYYFIIESIDSIACLFLDKFKFYKLFDILDELFSILGTIVYLELIEFKFCGLDYNLKKNIKERSLQDGKIKCVKSFSDENESSMLSNS